MKEIRKRRLISELTQYDMEKLTGISQARLSLIERGYRKPNPEELEKLSEVLKIQVQDKS
jgi:transcriptional regulator with XRE-family HTH domain